MHVHIVATRLVIASELKLPAVLQTDGVVELHNAQRFFVAYLTGACGLAGIGQIELGVETDDSHGKTGRPNTKGGRGINECAVPVDGLVEIDVLDHDHTIVVVEERPLSELFLHSLPTGREGDPLPTNVQVQLVVLLVLQSGITRLYGKGIGIGDGTTELPISGANRFLTVAQGGLHVTEHP